MANETRTRQGRAPATSQNSAATGVILVIAAVVVAIILFNAGGGSAKAGDSGRTAAQSANGGSTTVPTTAAPPPTTPPGNLVVVVGNGTTIKGRASATADKLKAIGYTNVKAVDGKPTATTNVYFAPGLDADAAALLGKMGLTVDRAHPMPSVSPLKVPVGNAVLVVLVGADFDPTTATVGAATTTTTTHH